MSLNLLFPVLLHSLSLIAVTTLIFLSTHKPSKKLTLVEEQEKKKIVDLYTLYSAKVPPFFFHLKELNVTLLPEKNFTAEAIKEHHLFTTIFFEIQDYEDIPVLEALTALITDQTISIISKRTFHELENATGRYTLAAQLVSAANAILNAQIGKPHCILNCYFSEFLMQ
jgi:flagellar basal body-associated protein FliL